MQNEFQRKILARVREFLESKQAGEANAALQKIRASSLLAIPAILGGCIRDLILGIAPRDVDIIVWGLTNNELKDIFPNSNRTKFGGIELETVDIWGLADTITLKGRPAMFSELPFTTLLNIDAVVATQNWVGLGTEPENNFQYAIENKFVELNNTNHSHAPADYIREKIINNLKKLDSSWSYGERLRLYLS